MPIIGGKMSRWRSVRRGDTVSVATKIDGQRVVMALYWVPGEHWYEVCLLVGATRREKKQVRLWGYMEHPPRVRGRCGLKALLWARQELLTWVRAHPRIRVAITNRETDARRWATYKRLLRVPGVEHWERPPVPGEADEAIVLLGVALEAADH